MTERGQQRNDDERRQEAHAWIQAHLAAWDVDPSLVASMSSDEVWAELEASGTAHEDVDALRAWMSEKWGLDAASRTAPRARALTSSTSSDGDRAPIRRHRRTRWIWRIAVATVVLCVTYAALWGLGRATRSPLAELAHFGADNESLPALVVAAAPLPSKGAPPDHPSTWRSEIRAGTTALLHARTTTLGLFPRYDPVQATVGVAALERAYTALASSPADAKAGDLDGLVSGKDRPSSGVIAFVIAKGYLMLDEPTSAQTWLQRSIHHGQHPASEDAATLLERLSDLSSAP